METEKAKLHGRRQRRFREIDDEADAPQQLKRHLHVGRALLLRPADDQDIVQIPYRPDPARVKDVLEGLRDAREDERSEAKAEWKHAELVYPVPPPEAKVAARLPVYGDVEVGVLQIDGRRPVAGEKHVGNVFHRIHPEVRAIDEAFVETLQIDDGTPSDGLRHEKKFRDVTRRRERRLFHGALRQERLHLRIDQVDVFLLRQHRERRGDGKGERRRADEGNAVPLYDAKH